MPKPLPKNVVDILRLANFGIPEDNRNGAVLSLSDVFEKEGHVFKTMKLRRFDLFISQDPKLTYRKQDQLDRILGSISLRGASVTRSSGSPFGLCIELPKSYKEGSTSHSKLILKFSEDLQLRRWEAALSWASSLLTADLLESAVEFVAPVPVGQVQPALALPQSKAGIMDSLQMYLPKKNSASSNNNAANVLAVGEDSED